MECTDGGDGSAWGRLPWGKLPRGKLRIRGESGESSCRARLVPECEFIDGSGATHVNRSRRQRTVLRASELPRKIVKSNCRCHGKWLKRAGCLCEFRVSGCSPWGVGVSRSLHMRPLLLVKALVSLILSKSSSADPNHVWRGRHSHISIVKLCINVKQTTRELWFETEDA